MWPGDSCAPRQDVHGPSVSQQQEHAPSSESQPISRGTVSRIPGPTGSMGREWAPLTVPTAPGFMNHDHRCPLQHKAEQLTGQGMGRPQRPHSSRGAQPMAREMRFTSQVGTRGGPGRRLQTSSWASASTGQTQRFPLKAGLCIALRGHHSAVALACGQPDEGRTSDWESSKDATHWPALLASLWC